MNQLNRRTLLLGGLGLAGAGLLVGCSGAPSGTPGTSGGGKNSGSVDKITVGYIADGNGATTVAVAEHLKRWEKHGLEADVKVFTNGPLQIQALGTKDLDFGYIGPGAHWLPMQGRAKIVAINSLGQSDRVIAQAGINSFADLKGKTVGVAEGTSADMLLGLALKANNMTVNDIKRVVMDPPTTISAFTSGQIDAAGTWYPHVATIKQRKPDLVEVVKSTDFPELAFPASLVAPTDITSRPEVLKKFQRVAKEASDWAAANRAELLDVLVKFLKAPKEGLATEQEFIEVLSSQDLIAKGKDGTIDKWLSTLNQLFIDTAKLTELADPKDYYLGTEYEQA